MAQVRYGRSWDAGVGLSVCASVLGSTDGAGCARRSVADKQTMDSAMTALVMRIKQSLLR